MKRPLSRTRSRILVTGGVALFAAAPVWADCCSGILSCAATIVTYGVSCEVQTIIDTVVALYTALSNLSSEVTGQSEQIQQTARQSVSDSISQAQTQAQQASSDLATALSQATALYKSETQLLARLPPSATTRENPQAVASSPSASPMQALTGQRQALDASKPSGTPQTTQSTVNAGTPIQTQAVTLGAAHGAFADAFSRAVAQITALKATSDRDFNTVNQDIAQAQSSEGAGITQAATLGGLMNAPLEAIKSQLASMEANPIDAFDPTSIVDQCEATVTANLSANVNQMINDISAGPTAALKASQPAYNEMLASAQSAQAIAAAMGSVYKIRTPEAAAALYALLPSTGTTMTKVTAMKTSDTDLATTFGQRMPYSVIAARLSTGLQQARQLYKPPQAAQVSQLHSLVTQFKAQRAQGKSALPQAQLVGYKSTLTQQFNGYFTGKTAATIATQRDQLIAQTRTQYAMDPATATAVIGLITTEAANRGAGASVASASSGPNARFANPAIPGQPTTAVGTTAAASARASVGAAPAAAAVPAVKTPVWGAAPAWTPAGTATATQPAMTTLRTAQPLATTPTQLQNQQQTTTLQAAPSSLGR